MEIGILTSFYEINVGLLKYESYHRAINQLHYFKASQYFIVSRACLNCIHHTVDKTKIHSHQKFREIDLEFDFIFTEFLSKK